MPGPLELRAGLVIPEQELRWRFSRASGPGGQHVNTSDTRVELSFDVGASAVLSEAQKDRIAQRLGNRLVDGALIVVASEHRSQLRNREAAEQRLARLLRRGLQPPPPPRRATKPTAGSVRRRLDAKRRRAELKRQRGNPSGPTPD